MRTEVAVREVTWPEIDDRWEGLITECFHPAYAGIAESFAGIRTVRDKLKSVVRYRYNESVRVWAMEQADELLGLMIVRIIGDELTILDLAVSEAARRGGIASKLFQEVARQSGCKLVRAEIRDDNRASLALAKGQGFEVTMTVHLVEWKVSAPPRPRRPPAPRRRR